jgi:F0F1-type ATP synthase membrane subunit b/b'
MSTRDEYVQDLKAQIDRWNTQLAQWEKETAAARKDLRRKYDSQLSQVRAQREKALYQLRLVQDASAAAWTDLTKGADEAAHKLREAVTQAGKHFAKSP